MNNWGDGSSGDDLERKVVEITNNFKRKFAAGRSGGGKGGKSPFFIFPVIAIIVIIFGLYTCFYEVDTEETGVILRFGKFAAYADPGLHLKMPFGIDQVYLVPTGRVSERRIRLPDRHPRRPYGLQQKGPRRGIADPDRRPERQ